MRARVLLNLLSELSFSQNELSSPIAANFCPTFFLASIFILMLFFLFIGIGQLDYDV